jgi:hypothetical protein
MPEPTDLSGWRIAAHPDWVALVRAAVDRAPVVLRPDEAGPPRQAASARLRAVGARIDEARDAWARARYAAEPADEVVAAMWTRWAAGRPFADQARWLKLLDRPVTAAFRQALSCRPLPPAVRQRALGDLRDALFYQLVGGGGFAELAAYVLETAPGGPVAPLFDALSPASRSRAARCVAQRGHWPGTLRLALPAAGASERALLIEADATRTAEDWIELHTALRLVATWEADTGDEDRDWAVVLQNQGRSRGRLRALAATEPPARLVAALRDLPGLAERTRAAARRWAWSWAWEALAQGFSFDLDRPVVRPCVVEPGLQPLDADDLAVLEGWLLLVILRGRGATARRWSLDGSGDGDGTWGRLLQELPADLRDGDGGFARIRAALAAGWDARIGAVTPPLERVATLEEGRKLKEAFWREVGPAWHGAIGRPRAGFPSFVRHARAWLAHGAETEGRVPG